MESNLNKCKVCLELRVKTEDGKFPNGKTKRYLDQFGKIWNGKVCPQCNRNRAKNTMKSIRTFKTPNDTV